MTSELMKNTLIIWVCVMPLMFLIGIWTIKKFYIKSLNPLRVIGIAICICVILTFLMFVIWGIDFEDKVAYKTSSSDSQQVIKVEKTIREKDKDAIYAISTVSGGSCEIPESIYNEYIGDDNNAITLHCETLTLYVASKRFGYSFEESEVRGLKRVSYPWEETAKPFTEEEIRQAVKVLKKNTSYSLWREATFPFDYTSSFYGKEKDNCLEEGAEKYSDRQDKQND